MNKERAREVIEYTKEIVHAYFDDVANDNFRREDEINQALDIAIESLDENERLKKERDYILEKAKAEQKGNEWVDVRDRLPSDEEEYLVCDNDKLMYVSSYEEFKDGTRKWTDDDGKELTDGIRPIKIIAWKPLPQPYERKE